MQYKIETGVDYIYIDVLVRGGMVEDRYKNVDYFLFADLDPMYLKKAEDGPFWIDKPVLCTEVMQLKYLNAV
jgi:hypothetical protein